MEIARYPTIQHVFLAQISQHLVNIGKITYISQQKITSNSLSIAQQKHTSDPSRLTGLDDLMESSIMRSASCGLGAVGAAGAAGAGECATTELYGKSMGKSMGNLR